jgi:prepilin peptidase CpaA
MIISLSALLFAGALGAVGSALLLAAWSDVQSFTIPNRLCAIIAAAYPLALFGLPLSSWLSGLATGAIALILGALLFGRQWVGGGDVKLASAVALWAGGGFIDEFLLGTSVAGLLLAAALLFTPLPRLIGSRQAAVGFSQPMPFGAPIAAGGLWVVFLQLASF